MTIARLPHPVFAVIWAVLIVLAIPAGLHGALRYAGPVLAAIALTEGVAVAWRQERRDTLSEITTWVNRNLSKTRKVTRGWNLLIVVQAMILGNLGYQATVGLAQWLLGPELNPIGQGVTLIIWVLFTASQIDHWLNPDEVG